MHKKSAFTLVELLVVIAIIGILMALTLPAIQAARESGRRTQCTNNINQITKAFIAHESAQKFFPTGGWGWHWGGDADRGFGRNQPGGWGYSVLPYLEESTLHNMGKGLPKPQKKAAAEQRVKTPVAGYNCPSRRRPEGLPFVQTYLNIDNVSKQAARGDYAANGGNLGWTSSNTPSNEGFVIKYEGPPATLDEKTIKEVDQAFRLIESGTGSKPGISNGISFIRSELKSASIRDGLSKTYCIGERYLNIAYYESGNGHDDNQSWEAGYDWDTYRWTNVAPLYDLNNNDSSAQNFGSAHTVGFIMSFCDGSTRLISYEVDEKAHSVMGNRHDGQMYYVGGVGTVYSLPE